MSAAAGEVPRGIVLFAHGARDPAWAAPFQAIRAAVAERAGAIPVDLAFLELMQPGLAEVVDAQVAQGVRHVTVVPLFMAQGGHLRRDLPELLEALALRHPGLQVERTEAIGDVPELTAAIAGWVVARTQAN